MHHPRTRRRTAIVPRETKHRHTGRWPIVHAATVAACSPIERECRSPTNPTTFSMGYQRPSLSLVFDHCNPPPMTHLIFPAMPSWANAPRVWEHRPFLVRLLFLLCDALTPQLWDSVTQRSTAVIATVRSGLRSTIKKPAVPANPPNAKTKARAAVQTETRQETHLKDDQTSPNSVRGVIHHLVQACV